MLDRVIAKADSVCLSVCHTRDLRLNGSIYMYLNAFAQPQMAPHTINTTAAYRQLHKRVIIQQCHVVAPSSAIFYLKTGSYSQNIIINAKANKYQQNHNQMILP